MTADLPADRLAPGAGGRARGARGDRGLLGPGVQRPGGGRARPSCWSTRSTSRPCPAGRRTWRQRVAGRPAAPRPAAGQLRPPGADPASCASCCATARRWCRSAPRRSTGCRRCWRAPTSSWRRWPPTSWGSAGGRCWRRSPAGRTTPRRWPSWPRASCGRSCRQLRQALEGRVKPHHRVLLARPSWPTSTSWRRRSRRWSAEIDRARSAPFAADARRCWRPSRASSRTAAAMLLAEVGADMARVPVGQAPGLLGRGVPGQPPERRPAPVGQDHPRQRLAARRPRGGRLGGRSAPGAPRSGPASGAWRGAGASRRPLVAVMHNLLTVVYTVLRRPARPTTTWAADVPRAAGPAARRAAPRPAARAPRLPRRPHPGGVTP